MVKKQRMENINKLPALTLEFSQTSFTAPKAMKGSWQGLKSLALCILQYLLALV